MTQHKLKSGRILLIMADPQKRRRSCENQRLIDHTQEIQGEFKEELIVLIS